jgi:hypothetical protein
MDLYMMDGIKKYLVSTIKKMDSTLSLLDKQEKLEREIYFWNYDNLEEYLRRKHHYDFVNIANCEEDSDEDHEMIRYFDSENNKRM